MMWSMLRGAVLVAAAVCAALGLAACQSDSDEEAPARAAVTLSDLREIEQLRTRFNEDEGEPRLILILSPT